MKNNIIFKIDITDDVTSRMYEHASAGGWFEGEKILRIERDSVCKS